MKEMSRLKSTLGESRLSGRERGIENSCVGGWDQRVGLGSSLYDRAGLGPRVLRMPSWCEGILKERVVWWVGKERKREAE